jgi:hypothetical protein
LCRLTLIIMNFVAYFAFYYFVLKHEIALMVNNNNLKYVLIVLFVANYPVYLIAKYITYSEGVRYLICLTRNFFVLVWWKLKHFIDKMTQVTRYIKIKCSNGMSRAYASMRTSWSSVSSHFSNESYPKLTGDPIRQPGHPDYEVAIIYNPTIQNLEPVRTWEQKMFDRTSSPRAITDQKITNTLYVLKCIKSKLLVDFTSNCNLYASTGDQFWANRFDKLSAVNMIMYKDLSIQQYINVFNIVTYNGESIMPEPGQETSIYNKTKQSFNKYINKLNKIISNTRSKRFTQIDKFIEPILIPV